MKSAVKPLFTALALLGSLTCPVLPAASWTHEQSDLKPDAQAVWGKLPNGMRYVVFPNKYPVAGRASVRLYVDAGSLMEEDDQRGMAHFLEHMAFNGSKNFAAGSMIEYFQRLGMAFGADTNAHTSFKETVYKLELPRVDEGMLNEAMQLFRDNLDGLLLGEAEITKERGVILSEKLARDSVDFRIMEEGYKFYMPDALIPLRMPIGTEVTIKSMPRSRFVDFYEKWYTPERSVIVVVGDVDIPLVEKTIEKHFASAAPKRGDSPDPSLGKITTGRGLVTKLHTEKESPTVGIDLINVRSAVTTPDSAARRKAKLVRNLADAMLNQRLSLLAKAEQSPVIEAESYNFEMFKFVDTNGISAKAKPENWKPALALIEQELRRAVQHGFTKAEFTEATADLLKKTRLRAEQKATRSNRELADGIVRTLGGQQVFTDPVDDTKRVEADLATLTAEDCVASFRDAWNSKDIQVFMGGNLVLENASTTIATALVESARQQVAPPAQDTELAFAYTSFGEPGKVTKTSEVADLEITQAQFANQVRANLKKTDFEKNSVRILVSFGGGKLEAPADKPGLATYAEAVFASGGLEKHSADDLRRIFASKDVNAAFKVGDDSFTLTSKTTPADLEDQLQLLCAYLTAAGFREEAGRQFSRSLDTLYNEIQHTAEGVMMNEVISLIHSNDHRFGFPKREVMEQRTLAEAKAWLTPALQKGYLEIAVVGDIDIPTTLDALGKTFGALPERAAQAPDYAEQKKVTFPRGGLSKDINFTTEIPRSYALAYWPTADMLDIKRTRRLILLGQILDDRLRLKIREELGETYSPASYHNASDTYTDYGYMTAMASLKPEQVPQVKPMFLEIASAISKGGITDDEFQRAREPQMQQLVQTRRDNRYWLTRVLVNSQSQPYRLEWSRSLLEDFSSIKKEDLEKLSGEYLTSKDAITIGIIPQAKGS